jgi:hypothetical protein
MWHEQTHRATVDRLDGLSFVFPHDEGVVAQDIGQRKIRGVSVLGVTDEVSRR